MKSSLIDIVIIGGGIVGMATARALLMRRRCSLVILEKEDALAKHQTGNNSGVIHSGLYYKPGSLKARNCVTGRAALYDYCEQKGIPYERCGKLVIATRRSELHALKELERRGKENGLHNITLVSGEEISTFEPHAEGIAGLHVPDTGIVDYSRVVEALAEDVDHLEGGILLGEPVTRFQRDGSHIVLETTETQYKCRNIINCAGLHSDRVARLCGVDPGLHIIPFRGEYYELVPEKRHMIRNLVYPVPDPRFPFLGVHFTRMIDGGVEAGPNAVLAFKREGYRRSDFSLRDTRECLLFGGFWKMAILYWKMGLMEQWRSCVKSAFVRSLQRLVPSLTSDDVTRAGAGVRAQALEPNGHLVDDFRIVQNPKQIHVLNAPSPAATACLSIGGTISRIAVERFFE